MLPSCIRKIRQRTPGGTVTMKNLHCAQNPSRRHIEASRDKNSCSIHAIGHDFHHKPSYLHLAQLWWGLVLTAWWGGELCRRCRERSRASPPRTSRRSCSPPSPGWSRPHSSGSCTHSSPPLRRWARLCPPRRCCGPSWCSPQPHDCCPR